MSDGLELLRAFEETRCSRCGREPHGLPDLAAWNEIYINGRAVGTVCPDCQTPEEAQEAVQNLATVDYESAREAIEARILAAEELREYLEATPDDGERLRPPARFAEAAPRFVGFSVPTGSEHPHLVTIWFPTVLEPDEEGVRASDGSVIPTLEIVNEDGGVMAAGDGAFIEAVPITDWMGWDRVLVPVEQGRAALLLEAFAIIFRETIEARGVRSVHGMTTILQRLKRKKRSPRAD